MNSSSFFNPRLSVVIVWWRFLSLHYVLFYSPSPLKPGIITHCTLMLTVPTTISILWKIYPGPIPCRQSQAILILISWFLCITMSVYEAFSLSTDATFWLLQNFPEAPATWRKESGRRLHSLDLIYQTPESIRAALESWSVQSLTRSLPLYIETASLWPQASWRNYI